MKKPALGFLALPAIVVLSFFLSTLEAHAWLVRCNPAKDCKEACDNAGGTIVVDNKGDDWCKIPSAVGGASQDGTGLAPIGSIPRSTIEALTEGGMDVRNRVESTHWYARSDASYTPSGALKVGSATLCYLDNESTVNKSVLASIWF